MNFFVIKAKYLAAAVAVIIFVPILYMYAARTVSVFNSGEREIPIYCVERPDNKIAVTFDCAWNDNDIDQILDTLDEYNCPATFFVVGDWAEKYPESLKKIYNRGHEIGNHSYNHADYTKIGKSAIENDLIKCDEVISQIIGITPALVRAPSGGYSNDLIQICRDRGTPCIQWSVDGIDYGNADPDGILQRSTAVTKPGDIILLHNGTEYTASVLPSILEKLSKSYEFSTVSNMIYTNNFIIDHTGMQIKKQDDNL